MKKIAIVVCLLLVTLASFGQSTKNTQNKKVQDPPKKEVVKKVPRSSQKTAQIKKTQAKKAQMIKRKQTSVKRRAKTIRKKRNGR